MGSFPGMRKRLQAEFLLSSWKILNNVEIIAFGSNQSIYLTLFYVKDTEPCLLMCLEVITLRAPSLIKQCYLMAAKINYM